MKPAPKLRGGKWCLDLRWAGLGQYTLRTAADPRLEIDAVHEAYALYQRLRDGQQASAAQVPINFGQSPLLREAADLYWRGRESEKMSKDNARYVRGYLDAVTRELGHLVVAAFAPPHGDELLKMYRNDLALRLGPKTRRNRLNVLMQVLRFSHGRGWLPAIPVKPVPTVGAEVINDPSFDWYTEADFRALRAGIYADHDHPGDLRRWIPDRAQRTDSIERRRLYLSIAFYTGMHTGDLDRLDDKSLDPTFGTFNRKNTKSAACIPEQRFMAPEQLILDGVADLERLQRHWTKGEPIAGEWRDGKLRARWPNVTRVMRVTAARLGLPLPVNLRIFRRSTAYHLCLLGWPEEEVVEYLGHVDRTMVNAVYRRVPIDLRSRVRRDWTVADMKAVTGDLTSRARVLRFTRPAAPAPARKGEEDAG